MIELTMVQAVDKMFVMDKAKILSRVELKSCVFWQFVFLSLMSRI